MSVSILLSPGLAKFVLLELVFEVSTPSPQRQIKAEIKVETEE
jgi:hypothetical protein